MKFKKHQLDRRHNGYHHWKYFIAIRYEKDMYQLRQDFFTVRDWCWTTWGTSKEINEWMMDNKQLDAVSQNPHWCWQNDRYHMRIYLRTDKELSQFALVWI